MGHFRTSNACLLRTVQATILAARFWRASTSCLRPSPQQPHTLTQYSKNGLIRLQYTTFALSLVRPLSSLPSIPTRFPAFEIKNKKFKKSKNGHFSSFFFKQYRPGKFLLRYSRTKKRLSRTYKREVKKVEKLTFFQRG